MRDWKPNKAVLALMFIAVVVSGCADNSDSGVSVSQTDGVSIEGFSATPSEIFGGQQATIELQLRNMGGSQANNVVAELYNVPFDGERSWDINSPSNDQKKIDVGSLRPADPDTDAPSLTVPQTWTISAPDLTQGTTIPYDFYVRTHYQYRTRGTTQITAMSDQRYREQGAARSQPTIDNTGGPIQIEVRTRTPVVFFDDSDSQSSDVCVVVENEGTGRPFSPDAWNGGSYDIDDEELDTVDVTLQHSGSQVGFPDTDKEVSMVGGRGVTCFTMEIEGVSDQEIQQTIPITFTTEYGYYTEESTSVTVNGRGTAEESSTNDGEESNVEDQTASQIEDEFE